MDQVQEGYADNAGVKIHYVTRGQGPLMVLIHGFPDFWYSWRYQMEALSDSYKMVALDLRGYNKSDKPKGQENYGIAALMGDVEAVIKAQGADKAIVVGHDWGGYVAWSLAIYKPELVDRLIVCNLPHPKGLSRELAHNPEQQANSAYARNFQKPDAHKLLTPDMLAAFVAKDPGALARYKEAFAASDLEAMLNYYKQNYPREPYVEDTRDMPKVKAPVLLFHGLKDQALHRNALNGTWDWVESDLTLVTAPNANHWVHHDAADLVSETMRDWLRRHAETTAAGAE
ncbi:MAG: alpha/beta hydrolase [Candidatus Hydrogenedentes bacterium]|nr:alpha/beta hydrolase [Candidatus Hydrogenedentota bacterium]